MRQTVIWISLCVLAACGGTDPEVPVVGSTDATSAEDAGVFVDTGPSRFVDTGGWPDAPSADATGPSDASSFPDVAEVVDGSELDAALVDAGSACERSPCFPGVECQDGAGGFACGDCPSGLIGDGVRCDELDACATAPCLAGSNCTDLPAPSDGYTCATCIGATCPELRAQAGPNQDVLSGVAFALMGSATGNNGGFSCTWSNDQDARLDFACATTATASATTVFTLEVVDASGAQAVDTMVARLLPLVAEAGGDVNILEGEVATLGGSWSGAACSDDSCISCSWFDSEGDEIATTCMTTVSPAATSQYTLVVRDEIQNVTASDSTSVFVTDLPANLCGWDVLVMTSQSYPSAPNPNYTCSPDGRARRQTVNGKPSLVLSDLVVQNAKIVGHIGVETSSDDDLIGFLWGFVDPAHTYLLSWKQLNQNFGVCGMALAGIAVKKVDAPPSEPTGISFNASINYNSTDYVYTCADGWATDRAEQSRLGPGTDFLSSPSDVDGVTTGWRDFVTYRFEIYYTPTRSRIFLYEDDDRSGSTTTLVAELEIEDSSFPRGRVAFFSNSQEQVDFGDFTFASLDGFRAKAGPDQRVPAGTEVTLSGDAELAVPPFGCAWSRSGTTIASTCTTTVSATQADEYSLTITDGFGRVADDQVQIAIAP